MVRRRNYFQIVVSIMIPLVISIILITTRVISVENILSKGNELQYNIISFSSIIGGFLFTGLSILISVIDKERIKRLWDHHYLDNLYNSALIGIIADVVSIVFALTLILCKTCDTVLQWVIWGEVFTIITSLVEFSWCVKQLFYVIKLLKTDS